MPKRTKCKCADPTAVAILARISDKEKQGQASLDEQLRETRERLVIPRGWHVVEEYAVRHRGSDLSRDPTYMTMIADARAGKFARLCLHKFDRFARRAYDREVFEHILTRECSVQLHAALEPYDLATRAGQLTKKTSAFISDVFLDNLREECLKGMTAKLLAGGWVGRAPFGYVNKREEIAHNKSRRWVEVDPERREVVALIFDLFESGRYTLDTMAEWLNGRGYLRDKGLPWRRDHVHRLLRNPFYRGVVRWNGLEAQGVHEPLVDAATWEGCQQVLRSHDDNRERGERRVYAVNRLLWWQELRSSSHAEYQAHADASYYRSRIPGPDGSRICIRCELVDDQVGDVLAGLEIPAAMHSLIRRLYRREFGEMLRPERSEAEALGRKITELESESRGYVRLAAAGKISDVEFEEERRRVSSAIAAARTELAELEHGGKQVLSDLDVALTVSGLMGELWERADVAHRKLLAHLVFTRISINNAGEVVDYRLSHPFGYLASLKKACSPPEAGSSKLVAFGVPKDAPKVDAGRCVSFCCWRSRLASSSRVVVLFDIDGTLVRTEGASPHSRAFKAAFRRVYGTDCTFSVGMHGMTDRQIFTMLASDLGLENGRHQELAAEACRSMVEIYQVRDESDGHYVALPGVREVLEKLRRRGVVLGLVTGNVPEIAQDKLVAVGLAEFFSFGAYGSEGDERTVLPPLAVARAEALIGASVHPRHVFVVGDTPRDVACALDNGYRAVAVATGHVPLEELRKTRAELVLPDLANAEPLVRLLTSAA